MTLKELIHLVQQGGPGFCQIAVTNACNARCRFCSFPQVAARDRVGADPERLFQGLKALKQAGVHYLSITGGEPLLYPDLLPALDWGRRLGLKIILCSNGALLTPGLIQKLKALDLHTLIISLDAASAQEHDEHRGLPGLTSHIREMLPLLRQAGLDPVASVTLSRMLGDLREMMDFLKDLGFRRVTFSYPLNRLNSSYLGFADHYSVDFTPRELDRWFTEIKELKKDSPLSILNPRLGLSELQRQLRGQSVRFPCLAGYKYFFVDWHLQVSRCHFVGETLGPLEEIHQITPVRDNCTACVIDCYRDPSVFQYVAVSVADTLKAWGQGRWLKGLGTLLHPYNFLSLAALLEGRHWVRG
ncbi:MAG: radical SAM protein [Deltaproteobacteria bacterium]|nr:radical SAM protein [Deltaproteobacteria bacterium]MBI4795781.1 radical SAM protein [Deltaproteobacteria bacterium]